ncbi:predicted protein [Histoplasma capsulatum G186AR]|uniref:Uncharacterized protein n=1 Tax=Ajellomyces capsulatus (strain G186AR / H82 / ATCC MYA-2454 / RMSCC 2432) TaxID=447093 RepID=C0NCL8_AJECG|nr:uncharacterized protein HCBG_00864 [Histoplasma capsulatum G186AR]EEH11409.1 predicted protein [Histoplasma capsulatum G186AR]
MGNAVNVMLRQAGWKGWDKAGIPKKSLESHPWASNKHNRIKALVREYARRDRILQVNYARTLEIRRVYSSVAVLCRRCMGERTIYNLHHQLHLLQIITWEARDFIGPTLSNVSSDLQEARFWGRLGVLVPKDWLPN